MKSGPERCPTCGRPFLPDESTCRAIQLMDKGWSLFEAADELDMAPQDLREGLVTYMARYEQWMREWG